jgi:hypothetical protein
MIVSRKQMQIYSDESEVPETDWLQGFITKGHKTLEELSLAEF